MYLELDKNIIRDGKPVGLPYIGSKKKVSKKLVELIKQNFGDNRIVYDLFGGGGAITFECAINNIDVVYNDVNPTPQAMIKKILSNDKSYLDNLLISRDEFYKIKGNNIKSTDDNLKLLINSFGYNSDGYIYGENVSKIKYDLCKSIIDRHKCYSGYRYTKIYKNILYNAKRENYKYLKHIKRLQHLERLQQLEDLRTVGVGDKIKYYNEDYKFFSDITDGIIYLDPPYKGTTVKQYSCEVLNYDEFYGWCKQMSHNNTVLISEYNMPDTFECVYEFKTARSTLQSGHHNSKYEKLWVPRA